MKTLEELEQLSKKLKHNVDMRTAKHGKKIFVGMDECGMKAGARDILHEFVQQVHDNNLEDVSVLQTDCMGCCDKEPVVKVVDVDGSEVTYANVNKNMVKEIVEKKIKKNKTIEEYTI